MQVLSGFSVDGGGRRKAGSRPFHGGNTGSSPVGRARDQRTLDKSDRSTISVASPAEGGSTRWANMRRMMGVVKNRHGTYNAQQKVPAPLQEAVASLLGNLKSRQKWLKKSLGTKDQREAHIRAKPVLMGFDRLLADAAALMKQRPLRTTLAQAEIDRIAGYHFATTLSWDEEERREGTGNEELVASVAQQLTDAGVEFDMPLPLSSRPAYGLSDREVAKRNAEVAWLLPIMQEALARGDISKVSEHLHELLAVFQINLDPKCEAYRK